MWYIKIEIHPAVAQQEEKTMEYEMVREIKNSCPNNQMRDIFFEEVETDDPLTYVKNYLKGKAVSVTAEPGAEGVVTVFADCDGLIQKFIFTPV
jgi:hypothetical protein